MVLVPGGESADFDGSGEKNFYRIKGLVGHLAQNIAELELI